MNALKKMLPYLLFALAFFYGVPAIAVSIQGDLGMAVMVLGLLLVNTVYSFFSGFLYALKNGFRWYFPVLLGALFIPIISTFYNSSATVYAFVYVALAAAGGALAALLQYILKKKRPRE